MSIIIRSDGWKTRRRWALADTESEFKEGLWLASLFSRFPSSCRPKYHSGRNMGFHLDIATLPEKTSVVLQFAFCLN